MNYHYWIWISISIMLVLSARFGESSLSIWKSTHERYKDIASRLLGHRPADLVRPVIFRVKRQEELDLPSEPPGLCTFGSQEELEMCTYKNAKNISSKLKWRAGKGVTAYWLGGPRVDHTEGDRNGGYTFFETSYERSVVVENEPKKRLSSRSLNERSAYRHNNPFPFPSFQHGHSSSTVEKEEPLHSVGGQLHDQIHSVGGQLHGQQHSVGGKLHDQLHSGGGQFNDQLHSVGGQFNDQLHSVGGQLHDHFPSSTTPKPVASQALQQSSSGQACPLKTGSESGLAGPGETALLFSTNISQTGPDGLCLSFYYNMDGLSAGRLRLILLDLEMGDNNTLAEYSSDGLDGMWQHGEIAYTYGSLHKVIFEAIPKAATDPSRSFRGYIALDDIEFLRMGPNAERGCLGHCTFEGNFCGWKNVDDEDDFDWDSGRGSQSFLTGPARDFSSFGRNEPTGGFAYIDASYPRRPGDKARLVSPEFLATGDNNPMCMRFATHMFGNGIGTLRVIMKAVEANESQAKVIWEITGEAGNNWYTAQVPVSSPAPFTLTFEATVGSNTLGNIAIDNVSFKPGTCPISPQTAFKNSGNCNFEEDSCGWNNPTPQEGVVEVDWARQHSFNVHYGPMGDHTRGARDGYYMNLLSNSQSPLRGGTRAWLISPRFPPVKHPKCIAFYYYMFERTIDPAGPSLGSLRIYVRSVTRDSSSVITPIWRVNNHQGQRWLPARAPIVLGNERVSPTEPFQVIIEGIWGDGRVGFIAIDDISFFDGDCTTQPSKATAVEGECSFEQDMCGWKNGTSKSSSSSASNTANGQSRSGRPQIPAQQPLTESLTWRMATPTSRPANLQDHTFRAPTGYAFFDIFNQASAQNPVLQSPVIEPSQEGERCLSFWFAPFGRGESTTLRVVRMEGTTGDAEREVMWQLSTRRFDIGRPDWMYGQVSVKTETPHQILFEGESTDGGFALDDITFYEGICKTRPDQAYVAPPEDS